MANAEVEDEVLGLDPTTHLIESKMAKITGKEVGLFVPSSTMGKELSAMALGVLGDFVGVKLMMIRALIEVREGKPASMEARVTSAVNEVEEEANEVNGGVEASDRLLQSLLKFPFNLNNSTLDRSNGKSGGGNGL